MECCLSQRVSWNFPNTFLRWVVYSGQVTKEVTANGVVLRSVELKCGEVESFSTFFWYFIKYGTDRPVPIATSFNRVYSTAALLGDARLKGSSLVIDNLQMVAEGRYMCQGITPTVEVTTYIDLTVLVPVLTPILQINVSAPREGSPVMLSCDVKNGTGPIEYIWQRTVIQEGTFPVESSESVIVLAAVNRSHTGWYTCTVKNAVNEEISGRHYLDVIYGPDEPVINIQPYAISENGFAANELEEVTLNCTAFSNPPCQYVWLYNNSQVYEGQMYIIRKISRGHTGMYTCLAKNYHLDTHTALTVSLTVYYLPEGSPSCTAMSHNNYKEVALWCSWTGGLPLIKLQWLKTSEDDKVIVSNSNATKIIKGEDIINGSSYTCKISHPALKQHILCRTIVSIPDGGPNCSAVATKLNEFVMLTCEWLGGLPLVMLDWNNKQIGDSKESSNIYVFKSNTSYNGKLFTCRARHPLSKETKECNIRLEVPALNSSESNTSVLEGNDINLMCYLQPSNLTSEIIWYNNKNIKITSDLQKYGMVKENGWYNLTIHETVYKVDSGQYRCSAFNAVGNSSIGITLQVKQYPAPPNVTINKIIYSQKRTEVDLEWLTKGLGDLTSFMVQRQTSIRSFPGPKRLAQTVSWETVAKDIEPDIRGHKLGGLHPANIYAFRILALNHKTTGFPSEVKTPADPPFNAYPAVIGAGVAGMIAAAVASLLVFQYIVRNRENNPRLHDLLFRPRGQAEARENIRNPEDAETAADVEEGSDGAEVSNTAADAPGTSDAAVPTVPASEDVPLSQLSVADLPGDAPVTVTATP
ncbi:V-set and immunoglobulin domain-containing protein 10-like 2 [Xenopus laevis]|uniref:V-set and immunoglobulin domain-containing protein 10-like 2 n=1 Tax=Xenopus laevis TaxID=8355 RepID=UPI001BB17E45|nr:V-set and immunoglobulin domain-containing protein 10-like 2 [Xenopus laevis]